MTNLERRINTLYCADNIAIKYEKTRPVLFACYGWGNPNAALRRAHVLARALRSELHILRVLPRVIRNNALFPERNVIDAMAFATTTLEAVDDTRNWCDKVLPDALAASSIQVRTGDFGWQAINAALELDSQMVVVPSLEGSNGEVITRIVEQTGSPVLVARKARAHNTIVAGTDLEDRRYPVMQHATQLARSLGVALVFVHNVREDSPQNESLTACIEQLNNAAVRVEPDAYAVVSNGADIAEALISEARSRDADILVVGSRHKSWFGRLFDVGVTEKIIEKAERSVLVTPMNDTAECF